MHKTPLRIAAFWSSALLLTVLLVGLAGPRPAADPVRRTGILAQWRLDADGSVYLRVDDVSSTPSSLWFVSPPSRNAQVDFSEMLLTIALTKEDQEITAFGQREPERDGRERERAMTLEAVRVE